MATQIREVTAETTEQATPEQPKNETGEILARARELERIDAIRRIQAARIECNRVLTDIQRRYEVLLEVIYADSSVSGKRHEITFVPMPETMRESLRNGGNG